MKGKILKHFIIAIGIWTIVLIALIAYASSKVSNIGALILVLLGLAILWLLVNSFIIVYFFKKEMKEKILKDKI
ncbi:hypothetical protein [Clostridium sp. LP20]|uniref:hypothetical protein n=1 Tax=Clostridium sp. LP20 TaxID=3418665 RepID=UPI003EE600AC